MPGWCIICLMQASAKFTVAFEADDHECRKLLPWSRISVAQPNLGAGGGCSVAQVALFLRLSTLHARAVRWGFARCKQKFECD